jgi:RHH-type proline utilization regulon transcriptional repressor/proline dehydrogenase/delta 1-pyrroline-5-carboxylate dehydrogenase
LSRNGIEDAAHRQDVGPLRCEHVRMSADTAPSSPSSPGSADASDRPTDGDAVVDAAVRTARRWLAAADAVSRRERRISAQLGTLLADEAGLDLATGFVDRVMRAESDVVAATALRRLVRMSDEGAGFLEPLDRVLLGAGAMLGPLLPGVVVPLARRRLRQLVGHMVLDATPDDLGPHLAGARDAVGAALNVNLLGEAVLGAAEARRRRDATVALVARDDVDYVSVKLSAIAAQIVVWDIDAAAERIADELRPLYRAAMTSTPPTFVNLDVEEYRDLDLTIGVFSRLLAEDEFLPLRAGIVLQAYLPDAHSALERLLDFAQQRRARGGEDIRIRLVKGANLSMELVEAELRGWEPAPYASKHETDANYKRCVDTALDPRRLVGARIGLASHNLFDVAWAVELARCRGVVDRLDVEMLQGMAPGPARVVREEAGGLRLYTPVVDPSDFDVAISYLVRRLEEVASPENFLRSFLAMAEDPTLFDAETERFRAAVADRHRVAAGPRRQQDRRDPADDPSAACARTATTFVNEADTDPSLAANREWARAVASAAEPSPRAAVVTDTDEVDRVVAAAVAAGERWRTVPATERRAVLRRVADVLAARRAELVAAMLHEGGKTIGEADPEVSELVDFARYYADRALDLERVDGVRFTPHRLVLVVPPWNFPVAIPGGGALAALAAGSAAILKPAPETPRCAEIVAEAVWEAGVDRDLLAFLRVPDDATGRHLVTHPDVDAVVLTGSYDTARLFRGWRPDLRLLAETSGKNALIVTPSADLDLAVADVVRSAFGHAGQKCSAASLAILVGDVATSRRFLDQLVDAATSLAVGPSTDLSTQVNRLIGPPRGPLARHLRQLDEGEQWLVEPRCIDEDLHLWTPGVKTGVRPGSHFHTHECFGPVLGVMAAADLDEAIAWQNSTGYGLTGGIHSLDDDEVEHWLEHVEVGNAYVNRHITGAIVQRQPFGGWKRSAVGPGAKAGGPAYVATLGTWADAEDVAALDDDAWLARARDDDAGAAVHYSAEHDATGLTVEANILRHRPHHAVLLRCTAGTRPRDLARLLAAARACTTPVQVSIAPDVLLDADDVVAAARRVGAHAPGLVVEGTAELVGRLGSLGQVVVRVLGDQPLGDGSLRAACEELGLRCDESPVVVSGHIEIGRLLREQSVSRTLHRYGRIAGRGQRSRRSPAGLMRGAEAAASA